MKLKKVIIMITVIVIINMIYIQTAFGHEFYKPIRWNHWQYTYAYIKVDREYLSSSSCYQDNFYWSLWEWRTSPTRAYVTETSYAESTCSVKTPTQSYWDSFGLESGVLCLNRLVDTGYYSFYTYGNSQYSNGYINYSWIYANPSNNGESFIESSQQSIIEHEIGHAYGLWHCPELTTSVMWSEAGDDLYVELQQHDIDDMWAMYP